MKKLLLMLLSVCLGMTCFAKNTSPQPRILTPDEAKRNTAASSRNPSNFNSKRYSDRNMTNGTKHMIANTVAYLQDNVYDVDHNGRINCRDYAYLFKYYWDKEYRGRAHCIIVYNCNEEQNFYHLFVAIVFKDAVFLVETQAKPQETYIMEDFWGEKYNPAYNETDSMWCKMPYIKGV